VERLEARIQRLQVRMNTRNPGEFSSNV